ncbi:NAD-dependent epimerase/dehydratase family protein [Paenibacillus nicotianae]|uniref:NAD-dependent epimerase/dehydratase family protein n=1 Tax=Paenibacillus nicotianae TaxID=1526551 RepID=A0ABW4URF6_9BACL
MTRALITGATGFLGGHMARRLVELGWEVSGTGRDHSRGRALEQLGVQMKYYDLCDAEQTIQACKGQNVVFHCAALSSPWGTYSSFYRSNVEATAHIVEGCIQHHVERLIHVSTPSVYFDGKAHYGIAESDPLPRKSVNHYASTKLLAEQIVQQAYQKQRLPSIIIRPRAIFGPMDQTLFPRLLEANRQSGVPLLQGGRAPIDLTYVDNVVDAMLLGVQAPEYALGQAYNISNGEPIPFIELLSRLFQRLDIPLHTRHVPYPVAYLVAGTMEMIYRFIPALGEPPLTRYSVGSIAVPHTLDISLAQKQLGYMPRISVDEGLERFADWWCRQ